MILLYDAESRKRGCLLERLSTVAGAFANYEDNARFVLLSVSWTHLKMPLRICLLRNAITTICRAESGVSTRTDYHKSFWLRAPPEMKRVALSGHVSCLQS